MQKLGQHFLKNTAALETIAKALEVGKNDSLIEIGPGHGELTMPLMRAMEQSDGTIIAIEKDNSLIAELAVLGESKQPGLLTIIEGDALKLLTKTVEGLASGTQYKIAGNIPYYITGKLLRVIGDLGNKPGRVVLLVQKEVAERICAKPPEMNRLAASVQFWAEPSIVALVPRKDFSPPPEVDSAIILLKNTDANAASDQKEHYYRAVRAIFAQPRKTLLNNLSSIVVGDDKKARTTALLTQIGVAATARPQDLSIAQIVAIAHSSLWG